MGLDEIQYPEFIELDPRYQWKMLFRALSSFGSMVLVLSILYFSISFFRDYSYWLVLALPAAVLLFNLLTLRIRFKHKAYALRTEDLHYKQGWLWRSKSAVPFKRIQHCEISQGFIDQMLELSSISVFTAGGSSADMNIPGLNPKVASGLKNYILRKIEEDEEE